MGYYDLLPRRQHVLDQLQQAGVDAADAELALGVMASVVQEWADYYDTQWEVNGERQEAGARDALRELVSVFEGGA